MNWVAVSTARIGPRTINSAPAIISRTMHNAIDLLLKPPTACRDSREEGIAQLYADVVELWKAAAAKGGGTSLGRTRAAVVAGEARSINKNADTQKNRHR